MLLYTLTARPMQIEGQKTAPSLVGWNKWVRGCVAAASAALKPCWAGHGVRSPWWLWGRCAVTPRCSGRAGIGTVRRSRAQCSWARGRSQHGVAARDIPCLCRIWGFTALTVVPGHVERASLLCFCFPFGTLGFPARRRDVSVCSSSQERHMRDDSRRSDQEPNPTSSTCGCSCP